jgi:hypothetical protein
MFPEKNKAASAFAPAPTPKALAVLFSAISDHDVPLYSSTRSFTEGLNPSIDKPEVKVPAPAFPYLLVFKLPPLDHVPPAY